MTKVIATFTTQEEVSTLLRILNNAGIGASCILPSENREQIFNVRVNVKDFDRATEVLATR